MHRLGDSWGLGRVVARRLALTCALTMVLLGVVAASQAAAADTLSPDALLRSSALPMLGVHANAEVCASEALSTAFGTAATLGSVTATGTNCHPITSAVLDDVLDIRVLASGSYVAWKVVDGTGAAVCQGFSFSGEQECRLHGEAPWQLRVSGNETEPASYTASTRRMNAPTGCSPLGEPAEYSFTAPSLSGTISGVLGAQCYTFTRESGAADGAYWMRTLRTSGTLSPRWRVVDPAGSVACSGTTSYSYSNCPLLAFGQFTLVVDDQGGEGQGGYRLTAKLTSAPTGCSAFGSTAFGTVPLTGSLASGAIDCRSLGGLAAGDHVEVKTNGAVSWVVIDGGGQQICQGQNAQTYCTLSGTSGWQLLIFGPEGSSSTPYSIVVHRLTSAQGCSSLGAPDEYSFTAARINGSIAVGLDGSCYTFSRAAGEEDGAYWFRAVRTAGTLSPQWHVYGPNGDQECSGTDATSYSRCSLQASGTFTVVVDDAGSANPGSFFLTGKRITAPSGCSTLPSTAFETAPVTGNLSVAGTIDCYTIPGVGASDTLDIQKTSEARWTLVDGGGQTICDSGFSGTSVCRLSGTSGWHLLVYDAYGNAAGTYSIVVHRVTSPEGCISLGTPAAYSFTAPRINGTIGSALGAQCYTFNRSLGEADDSYWLRTLRTSGTLSPRWRIFDPSGSTACSGSSGPTSYSQCVLQAAGQYTVVVDGETNTATGTYFLTPRRTTSPTGCATLPSPTFGLKTFLGNLSTSGKVDCYSLPAAVGDELNISTEGSVNQMTVVDATGQVICSQIAVNCTFSGTPPYSLLFSSASTPGTGNYTFSATCQNVPCGQSSTTVTDTVPNRVGAGDQTTLLVRGHDLELMEKITLTNGVMHVSGELQEAAADGRSVEARFNLSSGTPGSWDLEGTFIDGTSRLLSGAVTVEAVRAPSAVVQIVGGAAFRIGRPTTVSLQVTNTGNVDGIAVPVTLDGLPESATVAPQFTMLQPEGTGGPNTVQTAVPFNQTVNANTEGGTVSVPLILARLPAGRSTTLNYQITVPTPTSYALHASTGQCLVAPNRDPATGSNPAGSPDCLGSIGSLMLDVLPGGDCASGITKKLAAHTAANLAIGAAVQAKGGSKMYSPPSLLGWGLTAAGCAADLWAPTKIIKLFAKAASIGNDLLQATVGCLGSNSDSTLSQQAVASIDPNDIEGPAGNGAQHFISGESASPYRILFENLSTASAPAQSVDMTDQLDTTKFDPATALFTSIRFGSTTYDLPLPQSSVDEMIDLRPAQNLKVHVTADVSPAGLVHWKLQAIDPETLEPPTDPLVGFLPPNKKPPEGEGSVAFTVMPKLPTSGSVLSNKASIQFDNNPSIETPTWTNTIDRGAPVPTIAAEGLSNPATAKVSWGGTDDASGIQQWDIRVSKDGGPSTVWQTATEAGSATFTATETGTYAFRAVARDGAENTGQTSLTSIALAPAGVPTAPTNTAPPTITGTVVEGSILSEHDGTWTGSPTSHSYQWQRCNSAGGSCSAISGFVGQSYTLESGDVGSTIRVVETASNAVGPSTPATSAQSGVVQAQSHPKTEPPPETGGKDTGLGPGSGPGAGGGSTGGRSGIASFVRVKTGTGYVDVPITCSGSASSTCKITAQLMIVEELRGHKIVITSAKHKRTVVLASKSITLTGGQTATIRLTLNAVGRALLARLHRLVVKLNVTPAGASRITRSITFIAPHKH